MTTGSWQDRTVASTVDALGPLADPARAVPMAAYLRDQFPFLGIGAPDRRSALRRAWHALPAPTATELSGALRALWNLPEREYQHCGCDLLARYIRVCPAAFLTGTVQDLVTSRSWWDTVDALRSAAVGPLVAKDPDLVRVLWEWLESSNRWLVRSAIIHQLGYRADTDPAVLFGMCARRATDREFFIAKAIGWALRTYARQAPDDVRAFVADHPELSPLARREALKHLA